MTVSRTDRCLMWLVLVATCLAVYVVLVLKCGLGNPWMFFGATQLRASAPVLALFLMGCDLMRFVHAKRETEGKVVPSEAETRHEHQQKRRDQDEKQDLTTCAVETLDGGQQEKEDETPTSSGTSDRDLLPVDDMTGKVLFDQARRMPHQLIPDFAFDEQYLELLGKSAAAGYAPAMAKLGEYAMRRAAWVEAYYWMSMAKRHGMYNLTGVMREIRKNWSLCDFPSETSNVNALFPPEAGSIGRALLHIDSGREPAAARAFLKANHPEFVT